MAGGNKDASVNPLSLRYAETASYILEAHEGKIVDEELRRALCRVLALIDPQLVGLNESGKILGVSRQRVSQLKQRSTFPSVVGNIAAGPVWQRIDVEAYADERSQGLLF